MFVTIHVMKHIIIYDNGPGETVFGGSERETHTRKNSNFIGIHIFCCTKKGFMGKNDMCNDGIE